MVVRTNRPAVLPALPGAPPVKGEPSAAKISVLPSPDWGGAKFGWLMMLNISTRNWILKTSEIFFTGIFLKTEKSRLAIPGPMTLFRPELPLKLKHTSGGKVAPEAVIGGFIGSVIVAPRLGGFGVQFACQKARL